MLELREKTEYLLKNAWKWPIVWLWISVAIVSIAASVSVTVRETMIRQLDKQLRGAEQEIKLLEAQAEVLKVQNLHSIEDRAFIHQEVEGNKKYAAHLVDELNAMRAALKRLEARK